MSNKQGGLQRFFIFMAGKGFYVVLFLCVMAIGVSGYMLFFRDSGDDGFIMAQSSPPADLNTREPQPTVQAALPTERPPRPTGAPANATPQPTPGLPVLGPADIPPYESEPAAQVTDPPEPTATPEPTDPPDEPEQPNALPGFFWPVTGAVSEQAFTGTMMVFNEAMQDWRVHPGIDIETGLGNLVMAAGDGVVTDIREDILFGTMITIEHEDGYETRYGNLQRAVSVLVDQFVQAGDVIGGVGDTASGYFIHGPHLHFEMLRDGEQVNPLEYLPAR